MVTKLRIETLYLGLLEGMKRVDAQGDAELR